MTYLAKRIEEIRIKRNISLSDLSEKAHVSKSYLSQIGNGSKDNISAEIACRLARVLSVSISWLITGESDEDAYQRGVQDTLSRLSAVIEEMKS